MLTFKAIKRDIRLPDERVPKSDEYFCTQAESYEVLWTRYNDISGSSNQLAGSEPFDDRVAQVSLMNRGEHFPEGRAIFIGCQQQFERIYVMNESGQTIDVIRL